MSSAKKSNNDFDIVTDGLEVDDQFQSDEKKVSNVEKPQSVLAVKDAAKEAEDKKFQELTKKKEAEAKAASDKKEADAKATSQKKSQEEKKKAQELKEIE